MVLSIGCRSGCPVGIETALGTHSGSPPADVAVAVAAVAQSRTGSSNSAATESCVTACENAPPLCDDDDDDDDSFLAVVGAVAAAAAAAVVVAWVPAEAHRMGGLDFEQGLVADCVTGWSTNAARREFGDAGKAVLDYFRVGRDPVVAVASDDGDDGDGERRFFGDWADR